MPPKLSERRSREVRVGSTPWWHWLLLLPLVTLFPWYLTRIHYILPEPRPPFDASGRPQPSEEIVRGHMQALEDIGYRTVGTEEAWQGEQYVLDEAQKLADRCKSLKCEVFAQKGSGYHAFTILDHEVLKVYSGLRNIVLRISTPGRNSSNALLLGSHIDSTLPSPGAADDGIGVGVMLDLARVFIDRDEPFDNALLFMWNGGEETLQDGSHLYSLYHETAKDVKAMINLEAAGTTGGALLFQATSAEMIDAFSHAPYPRGTVATADVFSSGVLLSDTDFGQFEKYLGVSGLDMAIVGHSYFYHTRGDIVAHLQRGSAQHFGDNVLAIVNHLLTNTSALATNTWTPPDVAYFSVFDSFFFSWTMQTADRAYLIFASIVVVVSLANLPLEKGMVLALIGTPLGMVASLLSSNALAGVLLLLDRRQLWFPHEHLSLLLFWPISFLGHFGSQVALARFLTPIQRSSLEKYHYYAQLLFATLGMSLMQTFQIRTAYVFAGMTIFLLVGLLGKGLWTYVVPLLFFVAGTVEAVTATLDIFVPLTGRMGKDAPHEFIVATLTSAVSFILTPPLVPLFFRTPRRVQSLVLWTLAATSIAIPAYLSSPMWSPFDRMHPKRVGIQYHYNHTSDVYTAQVAFMDMAGNKDIVSEIHSKYGAGPLESTQITDYDSDWDILYPLPSFLDTWRFPLAPTLFDWPSPKLNATELDYSNGVRRLQLRFDFTGLVWPVLAFEAEVVGWSFDFPPPVGRKRHHLKIVASIDEPIVDFELDIKGHELALHYSAIDLNQMVPGTAWRRGPDMPGSKFLMEVDEWAAKRWDGALDFLMTTTMAGVFDV